MVAGEREHGRAGEDRVQVGRLRSGALGGQAERHVADLAGAATRAAQQRAAEVDREPETVIEPEQREGRYAGRDAPRRSAIAARFTSLSTATGAPRVRRSDVTRPGRSSPGTSTWRIVSLVWS